MEENKMGFICPICGKEFANVHDYAKHISWHSEEEKKKAEEEKKKRLEDQKKYDSAKLEKLYKVYENAAEEYSKAKEEYHEKYGESFSGISFFDIINNLNSALKTEDPWSYRLNRF